MNLMDPRMVIDGSQIGYRENRILNKKVLDSICCSALELNIETKDAPHHSLWPEIHIEVFYK